MAYEPRYDPHGTGGRLAGPWSAQPVASGGVPAEGEADDAFVRVGSLVLVLIATGLLAALALASGAIMYGLATWRRWRWWPLAIAGAVGLLMVLAVSGPGAFDRHLLALRELTGTGGRPLGSLVATRWPAWTLAQLPLGLPLGVFLAALGRHQVVHVAAHELSPRARRRRDAEDQAQLAAATRRATTAPQPSTTSPYWAPGPAATSRPGEPASGA